MVPTRRAILAVSLLFLSAVPRPAMAERLLVSVAGVASTHRGIARVQTLALDTSGLASLRASSDATIEEFPLGLDGAVTLSLTRFSPFAADTRVEVVEATGPRSLSLPDQQYYRGSVVGEPGSRAVVIATRDGVRGMVAARGTTYRFGRDGTGAYRSWAVRDADPAVFPPPSRICSNDLHRNALESHPGRAVVAPGAAAGPPVGAYTPTLLAELAIETDEEFLGLFAGTDEALDYLSNLAAELSAIYDGDVDVRIVFRFIRLWSTPDPWVASSSDTLDMLLELRAYWEANEVGTPRDTVHLVSGKNVTGGIAYLNALCSTSVGYGVSTVFGQFDVMDPSEIWDVFVVAHELGHNFGSPHTHCYVPPVDECYNGEADDGCYAGAESLPPGGGTIMSYCHQLSGGMSNINLTFDTSGTTVSDVVRAGATGGMCIGLPCGDGILDAGEDCDDGNITNGDCCSSTCTAEPDGGGCSDGEACTSGDQCASGACVGTPVANNTPCDDGSPCTNDSCQAGACVGVAAPAVGCKTGLATKSQLQMKDKSPDKGDQVKFKWGKGALTMLAELGDPLTTDPYHLCVYEAGPSLLAQASAPAGGVCDGKPCWKVVGGGFKYKDKLATPNGMAKVQLKEGDQDKAKAQAQAKGVPLDMPVLGSLSLPLRAQIRGPGVCFEATFSTPIKNDSTQFKAKSD